ncbi:hypothetical protein JTB14_024261 [Gonioctena quinquepunctata]|nr:hypothetical protein JTB14_024261 [Gonioctena quinquepunctata]
MANNYSDTDSAESPIEPLPSSNSNSFRHSDYSSEDDSNLEDVIGEAVRTTHDKLQLQIPLFYDVATSQIIADNAPEAEINGSKCANQPEADSSEMSAPSVLDGEKWETVARNYETISGIKPEVVAMLVYGKSRTIL